MYWSFRGLVAQQTTNGCNLDKGNLLPIWTVSRIAYDEHTCLLETTWGGRNTWILQEGNSERWLQDGNAVRLNGHAGNRGVRFGECLGVIAPAT